MKNDINKYKELNMHDLYVAGSLTFLKPEVINKVIHSDFPVILNIEPTNDCNLNCSCCPRQQYVQRYGKSYMEYDLYKKIIFEAAEHKPLIMINLHKDGEPLLHKELGAMIRFAKQHLPQTIIHLNTNGVLLGGNKGRDIIDAGIDDITVSIDAANDETYCKLKGVNLLFQIEDNVQKILAYRDATKANCVIRVKIMDAEFIGKEELAEFIDRWNNVADQVQISGVHSWSGAIDGMEDSHDLSIEQRYSCAIMYYALAVNADGTVSTCNVDWNHENIVGDFKYQSLSETWNNSAKLQVLRELHKKSKWHELTVCKQCGFWAGTGKWAN